jgi:hypothetical protein
VRVITVVVHPVDTNVHPQYPPGWRWAVHLDGNGPTDVDSCLAALMCQQEQEAAIVGEQAGAAAVKALRGCGVTVRFATTRLDHDPIPAEAAEVPMGNWEA